MRHIAVLVCLLLTGAGPALAADCTKPLAVITSMPMQWMGAHLIVPVKINGQDAKLGLATGNAMTVISPQSAAALGLRTEESNRRIFAGNGGIGDTSAKVNTLSIGAMSGEDLWFLLTPGNNIPPTVTGLMGTDVLSRIDLDLDFGGNKINLVSADHCAGSVLYWKPDKVAALDLTRILAGKFKVSVMIDGHAFEAVLDTGQPFSEMPAQVAENVYGLTDASPGMQRLGMQAVTGDAVYRHIFDKLTFDGVDISHARFNIIPDNTNKNIRLTDDRNRRALGVSLPVTIGMNVLRQLHVYFAFREGKVYLAAATKGVAPTDTDAGPGDAVPGSTAQNVPPAAVH